MGVLSAARSLASAGSVCPNGVAQTVPVASLLPSVSLALRGPCLSNVCRRPPPRSRLPVGVAGNRPRRVKAGPRPAAPIPAPSGLGPLVLALTGVVDLLHHTGGRFTHVHLASSFPVFD